ncbi:MAG TPA: hypothetical protein GXZ48_03530 [Acholeplasmataceae bacterium]|nr:hypothetical protein [Acholeplasmataceae bacterium]
MNNNRKQKVYSILDSLTQTELDNYIKERKINLKVDKLMETLNKIKKPESHYARIIQKINDDFSNILTSYYNLGMAWVIAFVLESFYDDKYKIKDLKLYLHEIMKNNSELKDMAYDCMKDF